MALRQYESGSTGVIARPTGKGRYQAALSLRGDTIFADEPIEVGGDATGPTPYELLSAALAACTAMTLRLYAERKGWVLPGFEVEVAHSIVPGPAPRDRFTRMLEFEAPVDAEQRAKLLEIADKCPVHKTLMRGFEIVTEFGVPQVGAMTEPVSQHLRDMEEAFGETV